MIEVTHDLLEYAKAADALLKKQTKRIRELEGWERQAKAADEILSTYGARGPLLHDRVFSVVGRQEEKIQDQRAALEEWRGLIADSEGVAGLHRNGDVAPWDSLLYGEFDAWLGKTGAILNASDSDTPSPPSVDIPDGITGGQGTTTDKVQSIIKHCYGQCEYADELVDATERKAHEPETEVEDITDLETRAYGSGGPWTDEDARRHRRERERKAHEPDEDTPEPDWGGLSYSMVPKEYMALCWLRDRIHALEDRLARDHVEAGRAVKQG